MDQKALQLAQERMSTWTRYSFDETLTPEQRETAQLRAKMWAEEIEKLVNQAIEAQEAK